MRTAAAAAAFPWVPIGSLAFISFASCFSVTYIFPIVPYLVFDLGMVDDYREPGLYAVRRRFHFQARCSLYHS